MCTIFLQILKIVCALFARGGWPLFILLPRRLVFSETHRGREGTKKGWGVISPGPRLYLLASVLRARSFLALLLFASQELVRDPSYRVRGSTYFIRDSAYRIRDGIRDSACLIRDPAYRYRYRRRCFVCDDFPLHDL